MAESEIEWSDFYVSIHNFRRIWSGLKSMPGMRPERIKFFHTCVWLTFSNVYISRSEHALM